MIVKERLEAYFALMRSRPHLFELSDIYPIVTDEAEIRAFERKTGKQIGVLYKSNYNMLIVDLIKDGGKYFAYERIVSTSDNNGVVCVPVIDGRLLLIRQYRHAIRKWQISFPRGFGENSFSAVENAKKELYEETGAIAGECVFLGNIVPDSGTLGSECEAFLCRVETFDPGDFIEGIREYLLLNVVELEEKIKKAEITDAFTLSAVAILKARTDISCELK